MRKQTLWLSIVCLLILAACSPAAEAQGAAMDNNTTPPEEAQQVTAQDIASDPTVEMLPETEPAGGSKGGVGIANPASTYCVEQGGTLELRTAEDGGMYGVCIFPDGSECEEWAYYRGECSPGQNPGGVEPDVNAPNNGWQVYTNQRFGYRLNYPPEAVIETSGVMGYPTDEVPEGADPGEFLTQLEAQYGNDLCLTIRYQGGYITVLPDWENSIKYNACGRTGVGAGEMLDISMTLEINGASTTAEGFEWHGSGAQAGQANETLQLTLADGTRITFGGPTDNSLSFEQYQAETRDVLIAMIESYQPLP